MTTNHLSTKGPAEDESANDRSPKRHCGDYDYDNTILILVGEEKKRFTVHKDVICAKSKFFQAACSDRWQEGQEKVVRLPEARSTQASEVYVDWVYSSAVDPGLQQENSPVKLARYYGHLIELYLLGDVLDDMEFRNKALDSLNAAVCNEMKFFSAKHCHLIWEHTAPNSPLQKWTVDAFLTLFHHSIMAQEGHLFPAEFVLQVAIKAMDMMKVRTADKQGLCKRMKTYMESEDKA